MTNVIDQSNWTEFLKRYSEENQGKPTRIGIFETTDGAAIDYWIEDGLPLLGLDAYVDKGKKRIEIFFEKYTHSIDDVEKLTCMDSTENDRGLDISDREGRTTRLRFEDWILRSGENNHG